jgi:hypothetical protein
MNKSQVIRGVLRKHPMMTPAEVVSYLHAQGIRVSIGLVYQVRNRTVGRQADDAHRVSPLRVALEQLFAVKAMVKHVGGMEKMKELLAGLEKLAA